MATSAKSLKSSSKSEDHLQEWRQIFDKDCQFLGNLLALRTRLDDHHARDSMEPTLHRINSRLPQLESAVEHLRLQLKQEREGIAQLRNFQSIVQAQKERIERIRSNLPSELKPLFSPTTKPQPLQLKQQTKENYDDNCNDPQASSSSLPSQNTDTEETEVPSSTPLTSTAQQRRQRISTIPTSNNSRTSNHSSRPLTGSKQKIHTSKSRAQKSEPVAQPSTTRNRSDGGGGRPTKKSSSAEVVVRPVSEVELNAAPQYVRGRMTVTKINTVASRLSEIASAKYSLMRRPNSTLLPADLCLCQDFQQATCDETVGHNFLTEGEIKGFGKYRIDATVKSAINILRHIGSLKEIRGKNSVRILLINNE